MPAHYSDPPCPVKGSYYKTTDAQSKLLNALDTDKPDKRTRELEKGRARVTEAIAKNKQDKSPLAWYTLAQIYLYQGDVAGADSALRHTAELAPKCAPPIEVLRYSIWAPLINAGAEFSKAGASDSALALFQQAAAIDPDKPQALVNAGVILANHGKTDSAIVYFQQAAVVAERVGMEEERNQATFNLAAMLQQANRHQEAAVALEKYLGWKPEDADAKRALAVSYRATGRTEKAAQLDTHLVTAGDSGGSGSGAGAPPAAADVMQAGVDYYNQKDWARAAQAFETALAAEPYNRDAVWALANSYLALRDADHLLPVGERLVAIEPMHVDALKLLGAGYRLAKREKDALGVAERLLGLPVDVVVDSFVVKTDTVTLAATATGRAAQTMTGKPVVPAVADLMFEFLNAQGGVVVAHDAELPPLKSGETTKIAVRAPGKGIVGYRYRKKQP